MNSITSMEPPQVMGNLWRVGGHERNQADAKVSDGSQPPMMFDLSLGESLPFAGPAGRSVRPCAIARLRAAPLSVKARRAGPSVAHAHLPRTPSPSGAASSAMVDGGRVVPDGAPLGLLGCRGSSTATEMPALRASAPPLRASCPIVRALAPPNARDAPGCMTEW
jgi:hypothetical protein